MSMTGGLGGIGGGGVTTAGIVILPNTGGSVALSIVAVTSIVIGSLIIVTTIARMIAKKAYKA